MKGRSCGVMWRPHESPNDDDPETKDQWAKVNESRGSLVSRSALCFCWVKNYLFPTPIPRR